MLDLFRKRGVMSVVYGGLMGAVIVVFIIQFRPGAGSPLGGLTKKCAAKVRGACIEEKEWRAQSFLIRGPYEGTAIDGKNTMDSLVERELLVQEASRLGVRVTDDDVMQELIRNKVHIHLPMAMRPLGRKYDINELGFRWTQFGTKEKPFDQDIFKKVVSGMTGQTEDEFLESQKQEILAQRVLDLVAERVRISDAEVWDQYANEKSTQTIRYVRFSPDYFGEYFVTGKDQETVQKWANDHAADVDAKDKAAPPGQEKRLIHARHVFLEVKKDAKPEEKAEIKKKADDLLARIKGGEDLGKLAKESSADPATKDKNGDMGWVSGYEQPQPFGDALAKAKVGDTAMVELESGIEIYEVLGRMDGRVAVAYPLYVNAKGEELAKSASDKLTEALKGKIPVVLDDALKAKVEEAKKSGKNEADATAQVIDDETRARMSKALDDILLGMAPPAPVVKDEKKKDEKKDEKKDDKAPPTPPPPAPLPPWQLDENRPRVDESTPFNSVGSPVIRLMDQQAIVQAAKKLTKEAPLTAAPVKADGDLFVVLLKDRHDATKEEFAKDRPLYLAGMLQKKREDALVNYVAMLRDGLGKDLTILPQYVADPKKAGKDGQPPIPTDDQDLP